MPLLVVQVEIQDKLSPQIPAIVDSGADITMFPAHIIEAGGFTYAGMPGEPQEGRGAGGRFEFKFCDGVVRWRGIELCQRFCVIEPPEDPKDQLPFPLLGRSDLFTKFNVQFNWHRTPPVMFINELGQASKRRKR
jgi:hypothetical protein